VGLDLHAPSPSYDSASLAKRRRKKARIATIVELAKIDFNRARREPRDPHPAMPELDGRDSESGASPVLPRLLKGTNCNDNPLNTYDIHLRRPRPSMDEEPNLAGNGMPSLRFRRYIRSFLCASLVAIITFKRLYWRLNSL
jgi:hypothetical protein